MKIGIVGAGQIGKTLVPRLSAAGHDVKVANSRGPDTIPADTFSAGGRATTAVDAVNGVDVVILSIAFFRIPDVASLIGAVPATTVVIDTSNYYPQRDGRIEAIDAGQIESLWVTQTLGRPVAKAWNAISAHSLATKGTPAGDPQRIALPVAADSEQERKAAMALVNDTGFDPIDAGSLADSWRQQPGAPCYCTDLTAAEMPAALAMAERLRLPKRRDFCFAASMERLEGTGTPSLDADHALRLKRILFM